MTEKQKNQASIRLQAVIAHLCMKKKNRPEDIASKMRVCLSTVKNWGRGNHLPSEQKIKQFELLFGVKILADA